MRKTEDVAIGVQFFRAPRGCLIAYRTQGTGPPLVVNTLDDTHFQKAQVTARGVLLVQGENRPETPVRFAITGGTGPYATAHGTTTEGVPNPESRLLEFEL